MKSRNICSLLALGLAVSGPAQASSLEAEIQSIAPEKTIEDMPGVYFDTDITRDNALSPAIGEIEVQVQDAESLSQLSLAMPVQASLSNSQGTPAERSGCPALALDSAVYTQFTAQGQLQCYSVEVTTATKIEGVLVNIPQDVDYNLYFFKLEDDNSFTPLDVSNSPSAAAEKTVQKVEPGIYILAAQSTRGVSAERAIMGWFARGDFDQYEANDKASQATALSGIAKVQGNMDNNNDLDFFTYQTGANQSQLKVRFNGSVQFSFELWTGTAWAKINNNQLTNINVNPNSSVTFLARGTQGNTPPPSASYSFTMLDANAAHEISTTRAWNNENLTNLLDPSALEAHQNIGLSGTVVNEQGQATPFATLLLRARNANGEIGRTVVTTDEAGKFSSTVSLPDCTGSGPYERRNRVYHGTPTNPELWWDIWYEEAMYDYILFNTKGEVVDSFSHRFAHICKEKLKKSCYWDRDYQNGGKKYKCNRI